MNLKFINQAQSILNKNFQTGNFTIPCEGLYPFQWKWDSGFIAIGFAHFDIEKAKSEITSILKAQWNNGFIPHIVFHKESDSYFPGPEFHQSYLSSNASKKYKSTGMTQPPVLGFCMLEIYNIAKDKNQVIEFIKQNIDKIYSNHNYFYNNRDVNNEGLVYIYHNWESGTDNSPIWDTIWDTMNPPYYNVKRKDTTHVDPSQRPTNRDYDYYLDIIEMAKKYKYDDKQIALHSPFLVQDPLFNAMLIKSNAALIQLYKIIGGNEEKITQLEAYQNKSIYNFNLKLYDDESGCYFHYDLKANKKIKMITSSSFAPIFSGIPTDYIAKRLVETINNKFISENLYLCSSFDPTNEKFNPKKYWRGPVWINLNWILYRGFNDYKYYELANKIKQDSIELVEENGFFEYFDPRKKEIKKGSFGYGGNNFSWTAALYLDLIKN